MKNGLTYLKLRSSRQLLGISPIGKISVFSDLPSKRLISMWKAYIMKHNPTLKEFSAHRIAYAIAKRPAYITYQTAYASAIADLGVQS